MKSILAVLTIAAPIAMAAMPASAYNVESWGKENSSSIYKITCGDGKNFLVRQESNGRWCSGSTCYGSLDALMRNAFGNCK